MIVAIVRNYFDYNATTPVHPEVVEAVARALADTFGNASSVHGFGQQAKAALDDARASVADLIGADVAEVVFTAGGTESDNFALRGAAEAQEARNRRRIVTTAIEHEAVLNTCRHLARRGHTCTILPVTTHGVVTSAALSEAMGDDVAVVSVMHANNEIGTVQPIEELAAIAHAHGALFHSDAVQTAGKVPVNVRALGIDLLSLSGHKFYGPKGSGALWIRRGVRLAPILTGGRHERNRRAGTENVPGLIGLGVAARLAKTSLGGEGIRLAAMRDRLERTVLERIPKTTINGVQALRVPNTTNISFEGVEAESLLIALDLEGIAVSTGSACSSGTLEPSHVLKAMNLPTGRAQNAIRFSLGRGTTDEEIDRLLDLLPPIVEKLRSLVRMPKTSSLVGAHGPLTTLTASSPGSSHSR
jgi:cysteine desulfurase